MGGASYRIEGTAMRLAIIFLIVNVCIETWLYMLLILHKNV